MAENSQQIKWAQKELLNGGNLIASAKMRLEGTRFESESRKVMEAIRTLNDHLCNYLRK